jgi:hypothetical protein
LKLINDDTVTDLEKKNEEQTELFEILGLEEKPDEIQHREKQWGTYFNIN